MKLTISKKTEILGKRIKMARDAKKLSQRDLQAITGVDFSRISKIENNKTGCLVSNLLELADGLKLDTRDLFNFNDLSDIT
jgi:transcriptional regulator with XRE-family HTH domain